MLGGINLSIRIVMHYVICEIDESYKGNTKYFKDLYDAVTPLYECVLVNVANKMLNSILN